LDARFDTTPPAADSLGDGEGHNWGKIPPDTAYRQSYSPEWSPEVEIVYDDLLHADNSASTNRMHWFTVVVHEM
jgi:hypothetical protein